MMMNQQQMRGMMQDMIAGLLPSGIRPEDLPDPRSGGPTLSPAIAARARGIDVLPIEVHAVEDVPIAFRELRSRPEVLLMLPDPAVASPEARNALLLYSFQNRVPVVSFARKYALLGAVLSLEVDPYDIGVQTGELVGKSIRGETLLPEGVCSEGKLTINRKVAQKMSLPLRESSLKRADIVW